MKICPVCGNHIDKIDQNNTCKGCQKVLRGQKRKEWWKKNWPWVATITTCVVVFAAQVLLTSSDDDPRDDDSGQDFTTPIHVPGEKYWNPQTLNWERDGLPYTYRVSWKDLRDGEIHTMDYADVDNGYEDYEYYQKRWYATQVTWEHIPPDET